ncbi:ligand-binding sensor domain-containing protein [Pseudohalioglobus lutimaris]|uniref:Histidine kinase domain-containing protein n=1 Tax=Pseudohalioglobus lutimaris TaxID=1737061 RepID=A0A2N5X7I6_9GAMM|nr:triple tyrosine motif-containing protein [Pseudohalioglobus lutimaris]PLW70455.1 hypothetical protein C0039_04455 [Pseudohalioglobus lutimaris]
MTRVFVRPYYAGFSGIVLQLLFLISTNWAFAGSSLKLFPSPISYEIAAPVITEIFQDSAGHLWVGTQTGLYRFQGKNFEVFSSTSEGGFKLPVSDIRGVFESSSKTLYIATYGAGLLEWNPLSLQFEQLFTSNSNEPKHEHIVGSFADSQGTVWLATTLGLKAITLPSGEDLDWLERSTSLNPVEPTSKFVELTPGVLIITSGSKIFSIDVNSESVTLLSNSSKYKTITAIAKYSDTEILAGADDGALYLFDVGKKQLSEPHTALYSMKSPITALATFESRIWVGTTTGLFSFSEDMESPLAHYSKDSSLSHNHVTTFAEVGEELFVGTYEGLNQIGITSFENKYFSNSGVYDDVMSFEVDTNGNLWVGTFGGLFVSTQEEPGHQSVATSFPNSVSKDNRIMTLEAAENKLWIGTWSDGVRFLDLRSGNILPDTIPQLKDSSITKILATEGDGVWVATFDKGLWRIETDSIENFSAFDRLSVTGLAYSEDRKLLAFTESDIYAFDRHQDSFDKLSIDFPVKMGRVTLFTTTIVDQETLIVGTKDHGALLLERSADGSHYTASKFGMNKGIPNISVYALVEDESGDFWASTNNGVFRLDRTGRVLQRYGESQGLHGLNFNFGAHYYSDSGVIYLGGTKGYTSFDPRHVFLDREQPEILISSLQVDKASPISFEQLRALSVIDLAYDSMAVTFTINVLDYKDPFHNQFAYKLQGFDPEWIDNGTNNKATYTSLPAGDYTFMAKGANAAGVWNEEGVSLRVRVLPPWWLTQWAYAFYVLCALCIVWSVMRLYRAQLLRQEAERRADEMHALADAIRDELQESQELQDGLVHSAYRHNVETIALIKQLTAVTGKSSGDEHLPGDLAAMEVLQKSYYFQNAELTVNLHEYVDGLCNLLLPRAAVDPATITTINLATSSLIPVQIATPLAIILYELLDNAMQHGFPETSPANFIQVSAEIKPSISQAPDVLTITVQDDGVGLSPGLIVQSARSHGFMVVNALTQRLNGNIDVELGKGTTISVSLPLAEETA